MLDRQPHSRVLEALRIRNAHRLCDGRLLLSEERQLLLLIHEGHILAVALVVNRRQGALQGCNILVSDQHIFD